MTRSGVRRMVRHAPPVVVRYLAGPDRIAHAVPPRGRVTRTACGLPATDERLTWPERSRCPRCLAAIGLLPLGDGPEDAA